MIMVKSIRNPYHIVASKPRWETLLLTVRVGFFMVVTMKNAVFARNERWQIYAEKSTRDPSSLKPGPLVHKFSHMIIVLVIIALNQGWISGR
jgi:hypothetical protein